MSRQILDTNHLCLVCLGSVLCFTAFRSGGVLLGDIAMTAIAVSICSALLWIFKGDVLQSAPRSLVYPLFLIPFFAAIQLIPLPIGLLRVLSPARAALADQLSFLGIATTARPLSVVPSATLVQFLRLAACSLVFFSIRAIALRLARHPWLVAAPLLFCAGAEGLVGIMQNVNRSPKAAVSGTWVSRNHFSAMLEMTLPLAAMLCVDAFRRLETNRLNTLGNLLRICASAALTIVILVAILDSLSRGGFVIAAICLLLVAGIWFVYRNSGRRPKAAIALTALGIILLIVSLAPLQLVNRFAPSDQKARLLYDQRQEYWRNSLSLIHDYPIFGCGWGCFESVFAKYDTLVIPLRVDHAHNDYLEVWAEGGAVSVVLIGVLVLGICKELANVLANPTSEARTALAIGCCGSMAAVLIHAFIDFAFYIPANAMAMAWLGGMATGLDSQVLNRSREGILVARRAFGSRTRFTLHRRIDHRAGNGHAGGALAF
jgi:O-antigen ligase